MSVRVEWDSRKANINLKKHAVSLTEREPDITRIISARLATNNESKSYEEKNDKKIEDMLPEYEFDYSKGKPNRFAGRMADRIVVVLDPDVAEIFTTTDSVNDALRALISAMPRDRYLKTKQAGLTLREK